MKLVQARIRGLGPLTESRWFDLSPHLNLFQFPKQNDLTAEKNFLHILQTINPPYAIQTAKPFADFPTLTEQRGHTRRINPAKRTVALAVFGATPNLVKELATISPLLYETDRIEVGRRLDYSRWINFVELASSSRWSEIVDSMRLLQNQVIRLAPEAANTLADISSSLKPTDRIKDTLQDQLTDWLQNLPSEISDSYRELIETTRIAVLRAAHFQDARTILLRRLPLFFILRKCSIFGKKERALPSFHDLLHLLSIKVSAAGEKSAPNKQTFLDEINNHLEKLSFTDVTLQIDSTADGLSPRINNKPTHRSTNKPRLLLNQIQAEACLTIALSRVAYRTEPILLFDSPEEALPSTLHGELADFIITISQSFQCLYVAGKVDIFPEKSVGRHYKATDLTSA